MTSDRLGLTKTNRDTSVASNRPGLIPDIMGVRGSTIVDYLVSSQRYIL